MNNVLEQNGIKPIYGFDNGQIIYFIYRNKENKKVVFSIKDFSWYFCLSKNDLKSNEIRKILARGQKRTKCITKIKLHGDYVKIYCIGDRKIPYVRFMIKDLEKTDAHLKESDLSITKRYMVDNMIEIEENLKYLFFDIETNDSNLGIEIGRDQILSWAACDDKGQTFFSINKDINSKKAEADLIKELINLFIKYDLVISWNGNQFDMPYIMKRIEVLDIRSKRGDLLYESAFWKTFIHIDLMQRLIKLFGPMMTVVGLTGFSLNEVSKVFLEDTKIEHSEKIIELYTNDKDKLKEYNIQDVNLLFKLNEKLRTLPLMIKECFWTGTFMDRFYIGELLDNYILREACQQNFHLKSRPTWEESEFNENIQIRGGYVKEPDTGFYSNVRIFDFKSMYPSIMVSWNIGQESLVTGKLSRIASENFNKFINNRKIDLIPYEEWYEFLRKENKIHNPDNKYLQTANNQYFKREKPSIIAGLIKKLLTERKNYKKLQLDSKYGSLEYKNAQASQEAVKEMSNSMYGITADKQSRFFDPRIAEAITLTGQFLNRTTMAILKKMGYPSIAGDTDSIFTIIEDDKETLKVIEELNKSLSEHLIKKYKFTDCIVYTEYEKKFRKFIMLDKKRYSGHLVEIDGKAVDSILSKGTENVRKNTIDFTKNKVNECFDLLLKKDKDLKFMKKWLRDLKEYVLTEDISGDQLSITMKISKPISSYKSKPPHVKLAEKMIADKEILETHEGKHVWGQKIEYIIVDNSNKSADGSVVLLRDFDGKWDRKYYWDVQIYAPLMRILKTVWPEENWEEHNIIFFEKQQKKIEQAEKKAQKLKEKEEKQKEREAKKNKKQLKLL
ncbi:MAG: DNA-directed DNA polymerase [Candidatus Pacearchaeota archaeon]